MVLVLVVALALLEEVVAPALLEDAGAPLDEDCLLWRWCRLLNLWGKVLVEEDEATALLLEEEVKAPAPPEEC